MITEEYINVKSTEKKPKASSPEAVTMPLLMEAIKKIAASEEMHKIRFDCSEEGALCTPLVALSQFLNLFLEDKYLCRYDAVILGDSKESFNISIIGKTVDYGEIVKMARHVGFSTEKTEYGIYLEMPKVAYVWSNLYAETRNKLLTLLGFTDF